LLIHTITNEGAVAATRKNGSRIPPAPAQYFSPGASGNNWAYLEAYITDIFCLRRGQWCSSADEAESEPHPPTSPSSSSSSPRGGGAGASAAAAPGAVIPVNSVSYEVFLLLLQFLYSGQVSLVPQKGEPRPGCGERACWHTHCAAAVDLALDTLAAARSFGVEELALLTQVTNYTRPTNSIADAPVLPRSLFPPNCNGFFSIADAPVLLPPSLLRATDK